MKTLSVVTPPSSVISAGFIIEHKDFPLSIVNLSIITIFSEFALCRNGVTIDRGRLYRQRKILMFYYEIGTDDTERKCDYRQSFHMRGL